MKSAKTSRPRLPLLVASLFSIAAAQVATPRLCDAAKPAPAKTEKAAAPATKAGAPAAKAPEKGASIEGITEYRLGNGMRVLLFPDSTAAKVTVNVTYFVGSRHEGYGESGMAHLLEHMVFKGTPKHPKLWVELSDHGAQFNGTTWTDRTNYYETLPAAPGNLEWALEMEADRMINSKIAAEDLKSEFTVVRNEFEMGENDPVSILEERMFATAYLWHNYGKSTIGSRSDIERVPIENLQAFYRRFYQPDNAMLVVAGKYDEGKALELIARHFGTIARPSRVLSPTYTVEPVQDGERAVVLRRAGDVAVAGVAFHGVAGADPEFVAESALVEILVDKPSGRLYKALVEAGLGAAVSGDAYTWAEPGLFHLLTRVRSDGNVEKARDKMIEVLDSIASGKAPITDEEVKRFQARQLKQIELSMTRSDVVGVFISEFAALGDWRTLFVLRDRIKALKAADVQAFAAKYVKANNRTVGLFHPTAKPDRSPLPTAQPDVAAMVKDVKGEAAMEQGEVFEATIENLEKRTQFATLPGGMKLALLPKKTRGKSVRLQLTVHFGSESDLRGRATAAQMVAGLLRRGTAKHTFQQINDELDRLKAEVSIGGEERGLGSADRASIRITTVRDSLPAVLALVTEMLRQPAFPQDQLEIVRKTVLARLEEQKQDPQALAMMALMRKLNPHKPDDVRYVPTVDERVERVKNVKLDEVKAVWRDLWGAGAANLVAVGDFDAGEIQKDMARLLGDWKSAKPYARVPSPFTPGIAASDEIIKTPEKEMALIVAAHNIELRDDEPEYAALKLSDYVLGASARSRLLERLRQKEGISYGAFSSISADSHERSGTVFAGAICAPQNAPQAMASLLDEVGKLVAAGVPEAELGEAKKGWKLSWDGRLAQDDAVVSMIDGNLYAGRTFAYQKKLVERVLALTAADLGAAVKKFIEPARLVKVRAGDLK